MRGHHRNVSRLIALFAALALCAATSHAAQLSPSVVLVLKLVAADRVQPVTGVVVSDDGLVLVPAGFVTEQAEFVVLDGGTDIIAHGRRAVVAQRQPVADLALLAVEGLQRPGITLAPASAAPGTALYLEAFPPARSIAAGDEPLRVPVQLTAAGEARTAAGEALPNVTGPLLDGCGYLAGLRQATGAQSLDPTTAGTLIAADRLSGAVEILVPGISLETCSMPAAEPDETLPDAQVKDAEPARDRPIQSTAEKTPVHRPSPVTPGTPVEVVLLDQQTAPEPASVPPRQPDKLQRWLQIAGVVLLALLAWRVVAIFRGRRDPLQPASDEPDTVQLSGGAQEAMPAPRSGRSIIGKPPDLEDLPEACNGLVVLEIAEDPDEASCHYCAVDLDHFAVVIGRGGADLDLAQPAVSRRHALLSRRNGLLTVEDLGSSNGTFVDRAPCLPGEIVHLEPGAELWLGEIPVRIELFGGEPEIS